MLIGVHPVIHCNPTVLFRPRSDNHKRGNMYKMYYLTHPRMAPRGYPSPPPRGVKVPKFIWTKIKPKRKYQRGKNTKCNKLLIIVTKKNNSLQQCFNLQTRTLHVRKTDIQGQCTLESHVCQLHATVKKKFQFSIQERKKIDFNKCDPKKTFGLKFKQISLLCFIKYGLWGEVPSESSGYGLLSRYWLYR